MRSSVVVFFMMVILVGCSPQKRLARLLERHPLPETTDTVYNSWIIYRDTVIYVETPGDTVRDSVFVPFEVDIPYFELTRTTDFVIATAWVRDMHLGLNLVQRDSLWKFVLDSAIRENTDTIQIETVTIVPEYIKQNSFWRPGFLTLAGLIFVGLILFYLLKR